ncbi:MAG: metallophosphoesterase family protein [Flexistipes sinusarabici]|uniref:Phosphoesterase n=1 Tax=Flexistipes sinusarabici TaxID=2352 RepID=A0A5D0MQ19_FLESI|nr:metallophosphoesterase family protein [Flexistipes sinusarabici]TYB34175.1 MAG: metallophosphoesterase family protein [Flexistipes sinusarabici]
MRILIISDTHTDSIKKLPKQVLAEFKEADLVIHAGDYTDFRLYRELEEGIASFAGVKGNMDMQTGFQSVPEKVDFECGNYKIGISHGSGSPHNIINRLLYIHENTDIIIFGHTHSPAHEKVNGKIFINPGSLSQNRWSNDKTYAVLKIDNGSHDLQIKNVEE